MFLQTDRPVKDIPLTSLALMTGMDIRKLAMVRNSDSYGKPKHKAANFISSLTPESCIVDLWASDSRSTDLATGQPKTLDIWGEADSLGAVVKESIRSRRITITSALERMKKSKLVSTQQGDQGRLESKELAPSSVREQIGNTKLGLDAAGTLLGTVDRSLASTDTNRGTFLGRLAIDRRHWFLPSRIWVN